MSTWKPTTKEELQIILDEDLKECTVDQHELYLKCKVSLHKVPIMRNGKLDEVFVVAQKGDDVMYYEDIEEGFNTSPLTDDGKIKEHWCNDDKLGWALQRWLSPDDCRPNLGPAEPIS